MPDRQTEQGFLGISLETWSRALIITSLFAAVFWHNLVRLWFKTNPFTGEANWSHAVVVPIIGLYYLFVHREDLVKAGPRPFIWDRFLRPGRLGVAGAMAVVGGVALLVAGHNASLLFSLLRSVAYAVTGLGVLALVLDWSLAVTFFGLLVFVYGIYPGQNDYLKDLGMIATLFGVVLMLSGPEVMKIAWFPIVFLICAIPWPGLVYSWVAEPLQGMAATVAVDVLKLTGVDSIRNGTKIVIFGNGMQPPRVLNVAEACAGMRSLMTFISVGGAIAFLSARPLWQKLIIVASAVPIAIFCNVMRISGQGLLDHYVSPQWSESFAHQFVGMMMLLPAFFLILGMGYLLDQLFIEEAEEADANFSKNVKSAAAIAPRFDPVPPVRTSTIVGKPGVGPSPAAAMGARVTRAVPPPSTAAAAAAKPDMSAFVSESVARPAAASTVVSASRPEVAPTSLIVPAQKTAMRPGVIPAPMTTPAEIRPAAAAETKLTPGSAAAIPPRPASAKPASVKAVATRPMGTAAPRSMGPATVAPITSANSTPAAPASAGSTVRTPSPPAGSVLRKPVDPSKLRQSGGVEARRIPPNQQNLQKPAESK